jgi:hypothetical protein
VTAMEMITGNISIKEIFLSREAWLTFWINNALKMRWGILWNVSKMLICRTGWGPVVKNGFFLAVFFVFLLGS